MKVAVAFDHRGVALRDGRWQLTVSQQTSIQTEPAREPVESKAISQK